MSKQSENTARRRLIILIFISLAFFGWTYINSYQDWGLGANQYTYLAILSIFGIWFLPKIGIKIRGIDDNFGMDILIGIGIGIGLIFLSIFNLVGSFVYGAGLFSIRVIGAGIIETCFFFILMIPLVHKAFKDKENIFVYLIVFFIVGVIFAFFHFAVVTEGTTNVSQVYGFFISATIIAMIWGFTLISTRSALPLILSHMMLNFWLVNKDYHWINFGTNSIIIPLFSHIVSLINM